MGRDPHPLSGSLAKEAFMSRTLNWLLSASLAVGSTTFLLSATAPAAENSNAANSAQQNDNASYNAQQNANASANAQQNDQMSSEQPRPQLPEGTQQSNQQANLSDLTSPIANAANAAMSKNGLNNMANSFDQQDQQRLNNLGNINSDKLDGRIAQLQKVWQQKYNQSFNAKPEDFSSAGFAEGKIQDPQQFAQNWPVPAVNSAGAAQQAAARSNATNEQNGSQASMKQGNQVAVVRLPAKNGMPAMDVSLVNQSGWKIDIPNDRTAQQIHEDVLTQLTSLGERSSQLPKDVKQANALVARHVLAGIYGVQVPQNGQSQYQEQTPQSQNQQQTPQSQTPQSQSPQSQTPSQDQQ
jgi:hypothetical protein